MAFTVADGLWVVAAPSSCCSSGSRGGREDSGHCGCARGGLRNPAIPGGRQGLRGSCKSPERVLLLVTYQIHSSSNPKAPPIGSVSLELGHLSDIERR